MVIVPRLDAAQHSLIGIGSDVEPARFDVSTDPYAVRVGKTDRGIYGLAETVAKMGASIKAGPIVRLGLRKNGQRRCDSQRENYCFYIMNYTSFIIPSWALKNSIFVQIRATALRGAVVLG